MSREASPSTCETISETQEDGQPTPTEPESSVRGEREIVLKGLDGQPTPMETEASIRKERENVLKGLRKRYPAVLWEGTDYEPTVFKRGWKPSDEIPDRLNGEEGAEWVASKASERHHLCCLSLHTYQLLESQDTTLSKGRRYQGNHECKNLFALGEYRVKKNLKVPKDGPAFKTPKRRNQDYKNEYEVMRMAFKKRLDKLMQPKSNRPSNLPKKPKDDHHDDDDQPGKSQGVAQTTQPLQPIKT